jgi:predicted nucleotidyltransferase component of viral defense system
MTQPRRDLVASIRERLRQGARGRGEDFYLTLQRYAVERLLFRLDRSPYRDRFVLKGAMLYVVWGGETYRPTRDLDLLGYGAPSTEVVENSFRTLCSLEVDADGLQFLSDSVRVEEIREEAEYGGIRARVKALLGKARIDLKVDIGFGDIVVPDPLEVDFPTLLGGPAPRIRAYSPESVIAEKLHAAAVLGDANSRMKDFYDLFNLSRLFSFEGLVLTRAIDATFERRGTALPATFPIPPTFFDQDAHSYQWRSYLTKSGLDAAPQDFTSVGEALRGFLVEPYDALAAGKEFRVSWMPGGPWR